MRETASTMKQMVQGKEKETYKEKIMANTKMYITLYIHTYTQCGDHREQRRGRRRRRGER